MNKAITIGATIMMSLSLAACGSNKSNTSNNSATSSKKVAPKYYKVGDTVLLFHLCHPDYLLFYQ